MRNPFKRSATPGLNPPDDRFDLSPAPATSLEVLAALAVAFAIVLVFTL